MPDRKSEAPWRKPPGIDHQTTHKDGAPSTARGQGIAHDIENEMEGREGMPVTRKIRSPGDLPD